MLRPAHFGDMHEAFDSLFEFDKRAVIGNRNDLSFDRVIGTELDRDFVPRMRLKLLESKRDTLSFAIVIENDDIQFFIQTD